VKIEVPKFSSPDLNSPRIGGKGIYPPFELARSSLGDLTQTKNIFDLLENSSAKLTRRGPLGGLPLNHQLKKLLDISQFTFPSATESYSSPLIRIFKLQNRVDGTENANSVLDGLNQKTYLEVTRQDRIQHLGSNIQSRVALLLLLMKGNVLRMNGIDTRPYIQEQIREIYYLVEEANTYTPDATQKAGLLQSVGASLSEFLVEGGLKRLESTFPGIEGIIVKGKQQGEQQGEQENEDMTLGNDTRQLVLSIMLHTLTQSSLARDLVIKVPNKDSTVLNPYQTWLLETTGKLDPKLVLTWLTSPGSDIFEQNRGKAAKPYPLAGGGFSITKNDIVKDHLRGIPDIALRMFASSRTDLLGSIYSALDSLPRRARDAKNPEDVLTSIIGPLWFLSPRSFSRYAVALKTNSVGRYNSELTKSNKAKSSEASYDFGSSIADVHLGNKHSQLAAFAPVAFDQTFFNLGGRKFDLSGLLSTEKDRGNKGATLSSMMMDNQSNLSPLEKKHYTNIILGELIPTLETLLEKGSTRALGLSYILADALVVLGESDVLKVEKTQAQKELIKVLTQAYFATENQTVRGALSAPLQIALVQFEGGATELKQQAVDLITKDGGRWVVAKSFIFDALFLDGDFWKPHSDLTELKKKQGSKGIEEAYNLTDWMLDNWGAIRTVNAVSKEEPNSCVIDTTKKERYMMTDIFDFVIAAGGDSTKKIVHKAYSLMTKPLESQKKQTNTLVKKYNTKQQSLLGKYREATTGISQPQDASILGKQLRQAEDIVTHIIKASLPSGQTIILPSIEHGGGQAAGHILASQVDTNLAIGRVTGLSAQIASPQVEIQATQSNEILRTILMQLTDEINSTTKSLSEAQKYLSSIEKQFYEYNLRFVAVFPPLAQYLDDKDA